MKHPHTNKPHTARTLVAIAILSLCVLGCKKPEVQVEEEGPPLPLPTSGQPGGGLAGGATGAGQSTQNGAIPADEPAPTISVDEACKLVDTAMVAAGLDITNRQCSHLQVEGDLLQLSRYLLPIKGKAALHTAYQFCLWPDENAPEPGVWRVGYTQTLGAPCLRADDFCKLGVAGLAPGLSDGCPGDGSRTRAREAAQWTALTGNWTADNGDSLKVGTSGTIQWKTGGQVIGASASRDTFGSVSMGRPSDSFSVGYAVLGDKAYFGRGLVTASATPESFFIRIGPKHAIRRFRGACYEITRPAKPFATPLECPIAGSGDGATISIALTGQTVSLVRDGNFWIDTAIAANAFKREAK